MTKGEEAKIRREGFPVTKEDARALLAFIDLHNPSHDTIEPDVVVKLEILARACVIGGGEHSAVT